MLNLGGNCVVEYVFIHFHGGNAHFRGRIGFQLSPLYAFKSSPETYAYYYA